MPTKKPRTKAAKSAAVEQTMHEFKTGALHSGSTSGPRVEGRAQAIAIALAQSGQTNAVRTGHGK